jgi:phosphoenolpyruvate carboxykinase (GTP)
MMLLEAESPEGETHFIAGAFPSASGKTNLAMLVPPPEFAGWKLRTIGDDIAWMRVGEDGRLYAVNPEFGFFGVAPGHELPHQSERDAHARARLHLHQRRPTPDNDVWWEGMDGRTRPHRLARQAVEAGREGAGRASEQPLHRPDGEQPVAVALTRRTRAAFRSPRSCSAAAVRRRSRSPSRPSTGRTASISARPRARRTTAAITGAVGRIRRDPMAMLAFIGYDAGTYFAHWLSMFGRMKQPPKIFLVNWFRKSDDGKYLWPGYGQNMRVMKWIIDRCAGRAGAMETPIGYTPRPTDLDLRGIDASVDAIAAALRVDP